jgi:Asp-tRNA(Asn)/Glu-tRNA(Gln) amidotransferase A subunit family amidase
MLLAALLLHGGGSADAAPPLNLETLSGGEAEAMLEAGEITSVELTEDYLARIDALNKAGAGLNAVTQINKYAMAEAEKADQERAEGIDLGPAMGLPILLKDIIDAKGMYTSAGDWALRDSYPEKDSGVAKELRAHGVILLGKLGLSEWANSFGSQPSGFSNLTGQVLNALDAAQGPSGSSSGSGAAAAASLAALTIGTETSGSIISPSTAQGDVGLRPTLGLVPGYGIAPIDASQDTAGPIVRNVEDAAMTLQSIAEVTGTDPEANAEYEEMMGPHFLENEDIQPAPFTELPDYLSALDLNYVDGKRIGYNGTCFAPECTTTPTAQQAANNAAVEALKAAGAEMVPDATTSAGTLPSLPSGYEAHATINEYYKHLGAEVPVKSLEEEVAVDNTNPQEGAKDGNSAHASESLAEITPGGKNQREYEEILPKRKTAYHAAIEKMMNEPSGGGGPVIAVVGSVPSGPQAGDPEIAVPMGYTPTQRRNLAVDVNGGAYDDLDLIGVSYVIEQGTNLRKPSAEVNPSAYRCAHTATAEPFASRGHCNPDYLSLMATIGGTPKVLPFALETTSATELEKKLEEGTLTSVELVKAELYRAALTNSNGPSVKALRGVASGALTAAAESDARRKRGRSKGALDGIPVVVDDSVDVKGLATSAGSIALQDNLPTASATLVKNLEAQGAVILGDTNVTEFDGAMATEATTAMPSGYSSLGGQALLPSDTNKPPAGSSAGSAAAVSMGLSPLAVGMETSTEGGAQMIAPASNAGLVALKPTVGLVSTEGVLPVAKSQDSPGPIAQTAKDAATELELLLGETGSAERFTKGQTTTALVNKNIAVVGTAAPASRTAAEQVYVAAENQVNNLGATYTKVTPGAATTAPSVIPYEFHRDLETYLAKAPAGTPKTLAEIIAYNSANPVEGLKYGQASLTAAAAVNPADPATKTAYEENLAKGRTEDQEVIDKILTSGGGYQAIMVPITEYNSKGEVVVTAASKLLGIADRAGYPVLTLPAGFGLQNSSTGGDPIGVDLIGTKNSEAELLADAYALEQGLKARQLGPEYMRAANPAVNGSPSQTNQSMFRCIVGSSFYKPYDCNPGEPGGPSSLAVAAQLKLTTPAETPVGTGGGGESTGGSQPGGESKSGEEAKSGDEGKSGGSGSGSGSGSKPAKLKLLGAKRVGGHGKLVLKVDVPGPGKLTLSGAGVKTVGAKAGSAGSVSIPVIAKGAGAKALRSKGSLKVKVTFSFLGSDGSKASATKTLTLVAKKK